VVNPEKHGEGVKDAYVTFDVSHYNAPLKNAVTVKRRYQDFCWLQDRLSRDCPTAILPPLPDRHSLLDMLIDRFSPDFINKRQLALQRYLWRVNAHDQARESISFNEFLNKDYLGQEQQQQQQQSCDQTGDQGTQADNSGEQHDEFDYDSEKHKEQRVFVESLESMQHKAKTLETQCEATAASCHRLVRALVQCASGWQDTAVAQDRLAMAIDLYGKSFIQKTASLAVNDARSLDKLGEQFENNVEAVFREHRQWMGAVQKRLLELSSADQTVATMNQHLEELVASRECILQQQPANGSSPSVLMRDYLSRKLEQLKGVDPIASRQQRLAKVTADIDRTRKAIHEKQMLYGRMAESIEREHGHVIGVLHDNVMVALGSAVSLLHGYHQSHTM
jgi:sorting nexin-4